MGCKAAGFNAKGVVTTTICHTRLSSPGPAKLLSMISPQNSVPVACPTLSHRERISFVLRLNVNNINENSQFQLNFFFTQLVRKSSNYLLQVKCRRLHFYTEHEAYVM